MDHLKRVERAIDYIEAHLCEHLPIDEIAGVAEYSMWHFQKVFTATVGEPVKDYIRKRRLTSAMSQLLSTERRIIDVAVEHQFESQESFTRAFKAMFGRTPGECRKRGQGTMPTMRKPRISAEYIDHLYRSMTMEPQFVVNGERFIVGLATHFISIVSPDKSNHIVLPKLWQAYMQRRHESPIKWDRKILEFVNRFRKVHANIPMSSGTWLGRK